MQSLCYVPNVNYQEQGEVKATFPATDIRYRGVFDKNVTITVDTITVDTVTMDPMSCMDAGANSSGILVLPAFFVPSECQPTERFGLISIVN